MILNCRKYQPNIPIYIEVENRSLVNVQFVVRYTTTRGRITTKVSGILAFNQMERIVFPLNSPDVQVQINNVSVNPPAVLKEGRLVVNRITCFEVNGTATTARAREVDC